MGVLDKFLDIMKLSDDDDYDDDDFFDDDDYEDDYEEKKPKRSLLVAERRAMRMMTKMISKNFRQGLPELLIPAAIK